MSDDDDDVGDSRIRSWSVAVPSRLLVFWIVALWCRVRFVLQSLPPSSQSSLHPSTALVSMAPSSFASPPSSSSLAPHQGGASNPYCGGKQLDLIKQLFARIVASKAGASRVRRTAVVDDSVVASGYSPLLSSSPSVYPANAGGGGDAAVAAVAPSAGASTGVMMFLADSKRSKQPLEVKAFPYHNERTIIFKAMHLFAVCSAHSGLTFDATVTPPVPWARVDKHHVVCYDKDTDLQLLHIAIEYDYRLVSPGHKVPITVQCGFVPLSMAHMPLHLATPVAHMRFVLAPIAPNCTHQPHKVPKSHFLCRNAEILECSIPISSPPSSIGALSMPPLPLSSSTTTFERIDVLQAYDMYFEPRTYCPKAARLKAAAAAATPAPVPKSSSSPASPSSSSNAAASSSSSSSPMLSPSSSMSVPGSPMHLTSPVPSPSRSTSGTSYYDEDDDDDDDDDYLLSSSPSADGYSTFLPPSSSRAAGSTRRASASSIASSYARVPSSPTSSSSSPYSPSSPLKAPSSRLRKRSQHHYEPYSRPSASSSYSPASPPYMRLDDSFDPYATSDSASSYATGLLDPAVSFLLHMQRSVVTR